MRAGPSAEFLDDARRAREIALFAAVLVDGEGEVALHRADGFVEVVAIERQAGFQAQRVAGRGRSGFTRGSESRMFQTSLGGVASGTEIS